jgi:hypothetical protein
VLVDPGSAVRVIAEFADFADARQSYMYHCHILEHEDAGRWGSSSWFDTIVTAVDQPWHSSLA